MGITVATTSKQNLSIQNATYFTKFLENGFGSHFVWTYVSQVKGQNKYIFSF